MVAKFLTAVAFAGIAIAAPTAVDKRANLDTTVLQFALTLEHLENVFYKSALEKFCLEEFQEAGYSADYYNNLKFIAYDEQTHVTALSSALTAAGVTPNQPCTYNFKFTTVQQFITLSSVLEGVGTSAYLGAAGLITSKEYLTVAGSILAVEALHTSMQRLAVGEIPMANAFETPLDPTSVYTLAAAFITKCPAKNAPLPFTAFPSLAVSGTYGTCEEPDCSAPSTFIKRASTSTKPAAVGTTVSFTAGKAIPAGSYVTFVNGLTVTSVKGTVNGETISAKVPAGIAGQTYSFVTNCDVETTFSDAKVVFGPAILEVNPAAPTIDYQQS